jgi:hypothetical protein
LEVLDLGRTTNLLDTTIFDEDCKYLTLDRIPTHQLPCTVQYVDRLVETTKISNTVVTKRIRVFNSGQDPPTISYHLCMYRKLLEFYAGQHFHTIRFVHCIVCGKKYRVPTPGQSSDKLSLLCKERVRSMYF